MRKVMKTICWLVFLGFIALSAFANWEHGTTKIASFMLAVVPVGFAASIFILEGIVAAGKASKLSYAAIIFVAAAAGVASYLGLYGMAREADIKLVQALLLPLAFDGVVGVASMGIRAFSLAHVPDPSLGHVPAKVTRKRVPVSQVGPDTVPAVVSHVPAPRDTVPDPVVPVSQPDVPVTRPGRATWDKELARKLLAEGELSRKDIAARCGTSRKSIDRLAAEGVEE